MDPHLYVERETRIVIEGSATQDEITDDTRYSASGSANMDPATDSNRKGKNYTLDSRQIDRYISNTRWSIGYHLKSGTGRI